MVNGSITFDNLSITLFSLDINMLLAFILGFILALLIVLLVYYFGYIVLVDPNSTETEALVESFMTPEDRVTELLNMN